MCSLGWVCSLGATSISDCIFSGMAFLSSFGSSHELLSTPYLVSLLVTRKLEATFQIASVRVGDIKNISWLRRIDKGNAEPLVLLREPSLRGDTDHLAQLVLVLGAPSTIPSLDLHARQDQVLLRDQ